MSCKSIYVSLNLDPNKRAREPDGRALCVAGCVIWRVTDTYTHIHLCVWCAGTREYTLNVRTHSIINSM